MTTMAEPDLSPQMLQRYADLTARAQGMGRRARLGEPGKALYVAGGVLVSLGLSLVVLGYVGVSRTVYVFEQLPYLASGGIFGGCLVIAGCFSYFAFWLTRIHSELQATRATNQRAVESLNHVEELLGQLVAATSTPPRRRKVT